jgi:hypothetical protein
MENKLSRRSFFKFGLAGAAVIPFLANITKSFAAAACPTTPPAGKALATSTEGMGKSLEYVTDATTTKNPLHKAGNSCVNCKFFNDKQAASGYAPCAMMGNKFVNSCGWCKSYKAKV